MLFPLENAEGFSGLLLSITPNESRGIYDKKLLSTSVLRTVKSFCNSKGVSVADGYRPGIGSAIGPSKLLEWLLRSIPLIGKAVAASIPLFKQARRNLTEYRKRQLRPFVPSVGIHFDIWSTTGLRERGHLSDLADTLFLLPGLSEAVSDAHPGVRARYLVTGKVDENRFYPVQIDSDACTEATIVKLATMMRKDFSLSDPPTHYFVSRRWGFWPRVSRRRDRTAAQHMVFLFPSNPG